MPKITMTETAPGADDGFTVREYAAGQSYDVGPALAAAFVGAGVAKESEPEPEPEEDPEPEPIETAQGEIETIGPAIQIAPGIQADGSPAPPVATKPAKPKK